MAVHLLLGEVTILAACGDELNAEQLANASYAPSHVTCYRCKLEQPQRSAEDAAEQSHAVPADVLRIDALLADLDRARRSEDEALEMVRDWSAKLRGRTARRIEAMQALGMDDRRMPTPQDFADSLAGFAARQREAIAQTWRGDAPWSA